MLFLAAIWAHSSSLIARSADLLNRKNIFSKTSLNNTKNNVYNSYAHHRLRTHNCEVATCIKMQANEGDCLAVGHRSGALTILRLPSSLPGTSAKVRLPLFYVGLQ